MNEEITQQQDPVAQPTSTEAPVAETPVEANTAAQVPAAEIPADKPAAETNLMACLSYCPVLFFLPYLTGDFNKSEVTRNSMNQGLLALITLVCIRLLNIIAEMLPFGIARVANLIILVFSLAVGVMIVIGMVRAYNNTIFNLPLIGHIDIFKKIKGEN